MDVELVQHLQILRTKGFAGVVLLLVLDVANDRRELGVRIRKRFESFLPREAAIHPTALVDEPGGARFDVTNKVGQGHGWF